MEIDKKTAKKVLVRSIAKTRIDADNLMKSSATHHQDFNKNADKLLKSSTAKLRLRNNINKRGFSGLTRPTDTNRTKAVNRLVSQMKKGEVNLDRGDRMSRHIDIHEKNKYIKSYNRGVFAGKVLRNMGKLSVPGVIATIMQPKKVGDATLNKGEYRKIK